MPAHAAAQPLGAVSAYAPAQPNVGKPDVAQPVAAQPGAARPDAQQTDPEPTSPRAPLAATSVQTEPAGFSPTGSAVLSGTKQSGNGVSVTVADAVVCSVASDSRSDWSCGAVALPNGPSVRVTASETADGAAPAAGTAVIDVLGPPALDGDGDLVTTGLVSGVGRPGSTVSVSVDGVVDARCASVPVESSAYWSCPLSAASGEYFVRAQQSDPRIASGSSSAYSNVQRVLLDRDAPTAAGITSPAPGARLGGSAVVVTGTGEHAASVDVYLDDTPACSTTVSGATWSCTIGAVPRGQHVLRAIQRDAAGNYAPPGVAVSVSLTGPAVSVPNPRTRPSAPPTTTQPAVPPQAEPTPAPEIAPTPPPADGGTPIVREPLADWSAPTGFGSSLGSVPQSVGRNWPVAPVIALLFVALVALPLRVLVTALHGRVVRPRVRLLGRNQAPAATADAAAPPRPWVRGLLPLAATAGLVALSIGVGGEVRYARLLLAITLGLALLNIVGGAVAVRFGARWADVPARLRFMPLMLLAAAITALLSRWTALEPPLITGVLVGAAFARAMPARPRAIVSLVQVGSVTVLGVLGWVTFELVGATSVTSGFFGALLAEALATVCLAGLGSALVLMLPVASLPGRAVLEWSKSVWAAATLAVTTTIALVVLGEGATSMQLLPWLLAATTFAALSVAVWAWVRFVEPQTVG